MKLLKSAVAILAMVALSACASVSAGTDASPRVRVAAASSDYLVVQEGIKGYLLLPPCAATTLPTCKAPAVVAVLQKGNATVSSALDYAEAVVVTPGASSSTIELALGAALEAVKSLKASKANFGLR
jgi:ABC-type Fe3+-hydroxamate transport system substrate-binding protein